MEKAVTFRTIMNEPYRDHPSEDALERFLFNQSEEEELEIVETHFLACETCVTRLEALELNIAATKLALKKQLAEQAAKLAQPVPRRNNWFGWLTVPQISFAGAAMAACALAVSFVSIPREVNLIAEQGNETKIVSEWVPLELHLQARDMKAGPVTVEIVTVAGRQIWRHEAKVINDEIAVRGPRLTASGNYAVRVYTPLAGDPLGELVREYSIKATGPF
jgi:hypothetical protein